MLDRILHGLASGRGRDAHAERQQRGVRTEWTDRDRFRYLREAARV